MTKKPKFELNRAHELTDIDAELDSALAKLDATTAKVTEILAGDTAAAVPTSGSLPAAELDDDDDGASADDESDDSEEE